MAAELGDLDPETAPLRVVPEPAGRRATHGVMHHQAGPGGRQAQVEQAVQRVVVVLPDVERLGLRPAPPDVARAGVRDPAGHAAVGRVSGAAAVAALQLGPLVPGRVVRGGEHHPAVRAVLARCERQRGRGQVRGAEGDPEPVGAQHVGNQRGELGTQEARVVAHEHEPRARILHVVGVTLGGPCEVVEREAVRDDVAPSVGTKLKLVLRHRPILLRRCTLGLMPIVLKYGGNAMTDPARRAGVTRAIGTGAAEGLQPVVVHGGGPFIGHALDEAGLEHRFVRGLRVTTDQSIVLVERTLTLLGKELASQIGAAIGLTGRDAGLLGAASFDPELGRVGRMTSVNAALLHALLAAGMTPVIGSLALDPDGRPLNINADDVAGAVAASLGAPVYFLTNVSGVLSDPSRPDSVVRRLSRREAHEWIADGRISGGMIPKVEGALAALEGGAPAAIIADGESGAAVLSALRGESGTALVPE